MTDGKTYKVGLQLMKKRNMEKAGGEEEVDTESGRVGQKEYFMCLGMMSKSLML